MLVRRSRQRSERSEWSMIDRDQMTQVLSYEECIYLHSILLFNAVAFYINDILWRIMASYSRLLYGIGEGKHMEEVRGSPGEVFFVLLFFENISFKYSTPPIAS
jgi:hypothetical protein